MILRLGVQILCYATAKRCTWSTSLEKAARSKVERWAGHLKVSGSCREMFISSVNQLKEKSNSTFGLKLRMDRVEVKRWTGKAKPDCFKCTCQCRRTKTPCETGGGSNLNTLCLQPNNVERSRRKT